MTKTTSPEVSIYQQANDFAKKHGIKLVTGSPDYRRHFDDDKEARYVFPCKLIHQGKSYSFKFGQSIAAGDTAPTMYDVLTCMQKYEVGSFEDFCGDFGYDTDSRKAERTYKAVCKEYAAMIRIFTPEILEEMQEIN